MSSTNDPFEKNPVANPLLAYEHALARQESELSQLEKRNNFFIVFQGVLIAGLMQSDLKSHFLTCAVSLLGVVVSFFHVRAAEAARFWFEWANGVVKAMEDVFIARARVENNGTLPAVFPYYTALRRKAGSTRAKRFVTMADPDGAANPRLKDPRKVSLLGKFSCFEKLFHTTGSCVQYVYAAYAFLGFWLLVALWAFFFQ